MQISITVGLDELRSLPFEWQKKILASLDLPVSPPAYAEPVPQVAQFSQQAPVPTPMPAFAPPTQQVQQPPKQPVMQNGVPTFLPDKGFVTQQSVALDVLSGQPIQPPV
jgi:hypothetical protein